MMQHHQNISLQSVSGVLGAKGREPGKVWHHSSQADCSMKQWEHWAVRGKRNNSLPFRKVFGSDFSSSNTKAAWILESQSICLGASGFHQVEGRSCEKYLHSTSWPIPLICVFYIIYTFFPWVVWKFGSFALQTEADWSRFNSPAQPVACTSSEEGKKPNPPAAWGCISTPAGWLLTLPGRQDEPGTATLVLITPSVPQAPSCSPAMSSVLGAEFTWVW